MVVRLLLVLMAASILAVPARAADKAAANDKGTPGDLLGIWSISGPGLEGISATLEFAKPDELHLVRVEKTKNGDVKSKSLGPSWKLTGKKLVFEGILSENDFEMKGTWTLAWESLDKLTATAGKGKKYQLQRVPVAQAANKPANKPAEKAAIKPAANAAGDLIGIWTVTGKGIGRGKLTMEFGGPDRLTVVRMNLDNTGTLSTGPPWKLSGNQLAFRGSLPEENFEVEGTWSLVWDGADNLTATTGKGKTFHLVREAAEKPANKPATKPTDNAAAKPAVAGDLIGTWTIGGPGLEGLKATLEFVKPDTTSLVRVVPSKSGDVRSQSAGPTWKLAGNTIAFHGTLAVDDFRIKGDWALAWDGPNKFTATTGRGKIYHLERLPAK